MARLAKTIGIAREGLTLTTIIAIVGVLLWIFAASWLGLVVLLLAAAAGAFFRDPERTPPHDTNVVISAADGRVCDIAEGALPGEGGPARRVSVFMSPLNVHINRAPVSGEVVAVRHTAGEFKAAFRDEASEHNERNAIVFVDAAARRHAIVQIAGYLARRIVCKVHPNERIKQGERVGLIMFGSRVDHFLPLDYRVTVQVGDRVRAGESILGRLRDVS